MRILQFIETGGPGGAESVVLSLCLSLQEKGVEVIVATLREGWLTEQLDLHNIPRVKLPNKGKLALVKALISLIKKEKIQIVHSHLLDSNFFASIAAKYCNIPHLACEHGDIHHISRRKFASLKMKILSCLSSEIHAVSNFTKVALINNGVSSNKVKVKPNPYNFFESASDTFEVKSNTKNQNDRLSQYLHSSKIKSDTWVWIHVANFRKVKDQITLLRGYASSNSRFKNPQCLLLVGDGELRKDLEEEANNLNISDEVFFLGFRKDVAHLLSLSDGFILSSISEAMPMSILEASKAKLVILSTRVGGIPEIIIDGKTGYLFTPGSPSELAEKIDFVINNQETARQCAEKANHSLSQLCDTKKVVQDLLETYEHLLKKGNQS